MIGLFFSQAILFAVVALLGFAAGWRLFAFVASDRAHEEAQVVERLRGALVEAQVRRARAP